jgi:hypothetical protein
MQLLAALGGVAFILVSLVVGAQLLLLARRTRQLPEFVLGLSLFLAGGIGYPLIVLARTVTAWPDEVRTGLFAVSMLFGFTGTLCELLFIQRVFRPGVAWARVAVACVTLLEVGLITWQAITPGLQAGAFHNQGLGLRLFTASHGLPLAWAVFESVRYSLQLARRAKLGLADPIVVDRVRLWGISIGSAWVINLASSIGALMGIDFAASTVGALVIAPLGLLAAGTIWLAFLPPRAYLRWVTARAATQPA